MGYHRKSAIRALARKPSCELKMPGNIGRPKLYEPGLLVPVLKTIRRIGQPPCGNRLERMMPDWVPACEANHDGLKSSVREQLLEASSAPLDRLFKECRGQYRKAPGGTKPGTMLRQQIAIRGGSWQGGPAQLDRSGHGLCVRWSSGRRKHLGTG